MAYDLTRFLDLEIIDPTNFRGASPPTPWRRVFGGLVIAQALVAAQRTVNVRAPHSLHAYFILPGDPDLPIQYAVENIRDGGSFSTRRCVASQSGRPIFIMSCSFHDEEPGFDHQMDFPDAPSPEELPTMLEISRGLGDGVPPHVMEYFQRERPVEFRPTDLARYLEDDERAPRPPRQSVWVRAKEALPDDPALHRAYLAYVSDMTLLDTSLVTHGRTVFSPGVQAASLDHALWFHRAFRADEWLLYVQDSPSASSALGLTRGSVFTREGVLVASVAQEGLIRPRTPKPKK